jgi:hypothetical protein
MPVALAECEFAMNITVCSHKYFILYKLLRKDKGEIEVTGRRGRRYKKLLDDLKDRRAYSHLKEETLDGTTWRKCFGRGVGPVVRQITV